MKIVLAFWAIALYLKLVASQPLSQENSPPSAHQGVVNPHVPASLTIVEKTVTSLNTKPTQLNAKSVVQRTEVVQGQIIPNSDATKTANVIKKLPIANTPVVQQNIQNVQTTSQILNKEKVVQNVEPVVVQKIPEKITNNLLQHQNNAVPGNSLHPQIDILGGKQLTKDVHIPVHETVITTPTVAQTQKQIIPTLEQSHIIQVKQLSDTQKTIPTIITPIAQPIQPIVVVKPKIQPAVVNQTAVNSASILNKKQEPAALQQTLPLKSQNQIGKPADNIAVKKIIQPQAIPAPVPLPSPAQASVATSTKVATKESVAQKQTILKINKSDPNSIAQAADYAAKAAVKAANEAIYSSASATKSAQEANEAAISAKNAALMANAAIEATKAELASRAEALKPSPDIDSADVTVTFSEKDADKLADIVVAAINRALQSIKIPINVPKSIPLETSSNSEHDERESESSSDLRRNKNDHKESGKSKSSKRTLVPKISMPIPSPVFFASDINSFERNSKLISSLTPKKLASISEPIYAFSAKEVDAAFESSPNEPSESFLERESETDDHNCTEESDDFESEPELKERISKLYELSHSDRDSESKDHYDTD